MFRHVVRVQLEGLPLPYHEAQVVATPADVVTVHLSLVQFTEGVTRSILAALWMQLEAILGVFPHVVSDLSGQTRRCECPD